MSSESSQSEHLRKEYQNLKTLKSEFDVELEKATTGAENPEEVKKALQKSKALKGELEQRRDALWEKLPSKEIKGIWENPETGRKKEIVLTIEQELQISKSCGRKRVLS